MLNNAVYNRNTAEKNQDLFIMNNKRNKPSKKKLKGSAPQEKKEPTTVPNDSITNESTKGVALDDVNATIRNEDLPAFNHFFDDMKFTYSTKGTKASAKVDKLPKVNPLPTNAIIKTLETIWDINNSDLIKKGFNKRQATFYSGATIKELMLGLETIIPDDYSPTNRVGKQLKSTKAKNWKLKAVGKETVNRRIKELVATGEVVIFSFDAKGHFVPISKMTSDLTKYIGSVHHIEQIKRHLHDKSQWLTLYRDWFIKKFPIPMNVDINEFDEILSLTNDVLRTFWNGKVFDLETLRTYIKKDK